MKLNQKQRYALFGWLCQNINRFMDMQTVYDFDRFCDGEMSEWRVINGFGMAGKLWNNCGKIYITGYSPVEIGGHESKAWKDQQEKIDKWNEEINELIGIYDSSFDSAKKPCHELCARCKGEKEAPVYCNCGYGFSNLEGQD